jgi:hypothetical protein
MIATHDNLELLPGAGTGSPPDVARKRHKHAGVLLLLALLVPLGARATTPDEQYADKLAQHLSRTLPGLTAAAIELPIQPQCAADQLEISTIRSSVFGSSTLTLHCKGSDSLPFTAVLKTKPTQSQTPPVKAPVVRSGCKVRLEIAAQGVYITTTASTLAAGDVGDTIAVRATRNNRVLQARVIDSSTVRAVTGASQ